MPESILCIYAALVFNWNSNIIFHLKYSNRTTYSKWSINIWNKKTIEMCIFMHARHHAFNRCKQTTSKKKHQILFDVGIGRWVRCQVQKWAVETKATEFLRVYIRRRKNVCKIKKTQLICVFSRRKNERITNCLSFWMYEIHFLYVEKKNRFRSYFY